jgi:uncharacterized protein YbbC (DUF1343 family)/CubicO group peptidase (beta-lactamase class C family)
MPTLFKAGLTVVFAILALAFVRTPSATGAALRANHPSAARGISAARGQAHAPESANRLTAAALAPISDVARSEVQNRDIPGAVVLIGNRRRVIYWRAFGYLIRHPRPIPMPRNAIFDLASLTKAVATTAAVMQLIERGKLELAAPAARYWPAFGANGKHRITLRELLTHYSGLAPDLKLAHPWSGYPEAMRKIVAERPIRPPGTAYIYSDINFEVLGEIVRRVSGERLDRYCARHIFGPLKMRDTSFRPARYKLYRVAPTEKIGDVIRRGEVNDPTAYRMGGVSGDAGLFSTANDLAIFARMLLNGGSINGVRILRPATVAAMTTPESPRRGSRLRGFGWDIGGPLASNRDALAPVGSYGHTGYTGTLIWIDPVSKTYVIVLTNRVYPDGKGNAWPLRSAVLALVADALGPRSEAQVISAEPLLHRYFADHPALMSEPRGLETGADVLVADHFAPLRGLRVGVITNEASADSKGRQIVDVLRSAPGVRLTDIFSPEHGLYENLDGEVASGTYTASGLPVLSLYGPVRHPTGTMLDHIDALVFDVQDSGARFYTYATTMAYAMEAAARKGIDFYVLDRPDPITGATVQGPVMDPAMKSFTGYFPMPTRHGMTIGELARMFDAQNRIGAKLHVIRMRGYRRGEWFDETGLRWRPPSPNLRTLDEAILYPGVGMVEGADVSVGRGTATPFELVGAPWIDAARMAAYLNHRKIAGVLFAAADFTPSASAYRGRLCHGVRIVPIDRDRLDSPQLGIELISALRRLYPGKFALQQTLGMVGARWVLSALEEGNDPRSVEQDWQARLARFETLRARYLLY